MKIKHWAGYGTVTATKIKDNGCTLHIRVSGNHECGLRRDAWDLYLLCDWLVKRFDKRVTDAVEWASQYPIVDIREGWTAESDYCDYYFTYTH